MERSFYYVQEIAVDEALRRHGVARDFVEFMYVDAKKRGFDKIELDVWAFNENAVEFY